MPVWEEVHMWWRSVVTTLRSPEEPARKEMMEGQSYYAFLFFEYSKLLVFGREGKGRFAMNLISERFFRTRAVRGGEGGGAGLRVPRDEAILCG